MSSLIAWIKSFVFNWGLPPHNHWKDRYWKNVPGPFYSTTDNMMELMSSPLSPGHLTYDDECEFVWRQPSCREEHAAVIAAINCDVCDSYGRDGNDHWTEAAVIQWWERRIELREWGESLLRRPVKDAEKFRNGHDDAVDEEQATHFLRFLEDGLEDYLESYLFYLRNGRVPRPGEELPTLCGG